MSWTLAVRYSWRMASRLKMQTGFYPGRTRAVQEMSSALAQSSGMTRVMDVEIVIDETESNLRNASVKSDALLVLVASHLGTFVRLNAPTAVLAHILTPTANYTPPARNSLAYLCSSVGSPFWSCWHAAMCQTSFTRVNCMTSLFLIRAKGAETTFISNSRIQMNGSSTQ